MMGIIESILFASGDPVSAKEIGQLLELDVRTVRKLLSKMCDCFNFERRGLQVIIVNDTYQLATRPEYSDYIEKYLGQERAQSLSQASLETLAVVAYKQPVTKAEIEAIRGVKCDYIINTLVNRGFIQEVARKDTPGRPILYGTTDLFLRSFGLTSLEDLPPLESMESE